MTKTEVKEKNKVGEMTLFNLKTKLSNYHVTVNNQSGSNQRIPLHNK